MDPFHQRVAIARCVREASQALLEASERASDLHRFQLSTELLEQGMELLELAGELLKLAGQPSLREQRPDLPF
jgi:hypothetical protein